MAKKTENLTFEEALDALEKAAGAIKREDITLEEAMKAYEEGAKYYDICTGILEEAEGKITLLREKAAE